MWAILWRKGNPLILHYFSCTGYYQFSRIWLPPIRFTRTEILNIFMREYKNIKAAVSIVDVKKFEWYKIIVAIIYSLLFQNNNECRNIELQITKVITVNANIIQTTLKNRWQCEVNCYKNSMDWANQKLAEGNENAVANENMYNWRKQSNLKRFQRETLRDAIERFKVEIKIIVYYYKLLGNMYISEQ
jgi:hypothetical protein